MNRITNRSTTLAAVLALTACAASNPNQVRDTEERVTVSDGAGSRIVDLRITREHDVQSIQLEAPRDTVWALLPEVYEEVGLPVPIIDEATWTVAVQNHTVMRRIGSERMSSLIDCGRSMTGANADTHRIRLSVRTWLVQMGNTTQANTRLEAEATSVEGRAGSITCTTRGGLEQLILNSLQRRIVNGQGTRAQATRP